MDIAIRLMLGVSLRVQTGKVPIEKKLRSSSVALSR
jgi:hypothetical protein